MAYQDKIVQITNRLRIGACFKRSFVLRGVPPGVLLREVFQASL